MCDPHPVPPGRADTEAAPSPSPGAGVGVACGRGTRRSRELPSEPFVSPWDREGQEGPANKRVNDEMERDARLSAKTGTVPNWHHGLRASPLCRSDFHSRRCRSCSLRHLRRRVVPRRRAPANHGPGCLSASPGALSRETPFAAISVISIRPSHGRATAEPRRLRSSPRAATPEPTRSGLYHTQQGRAGEE